MGADVRRHLSSFVTDWNRQFKGICGAFYMYGFKKYKMLLNKSSSMFGRMDFNKSINSNRITVSLTVLAAISDLKREHCSDR